MQVVYVFSTPGDGCIQPCRWWIYSVLYYNQHCRWWMYSALQVVDVFSTADGGCIQYCRWWMYTVLYNNQSCRWWVYSSIGPGYLGEPEAMIRDRTDSSPSLYSSMEWVTKVIRGIVPYCSHAF